MTAPTPTVKDQSRAGTDRRALLLCILAVAGCTLLTIPVVEMGLNDDWSYTLTARSLAQTGHLAYNGWATAMIGAQAYWAALWIKLFGFSFTLVRLTTLPFAAGCAAVLYALGRRIGLVSSLAAFGALTVTLSPLFLPLAASFMTDVPAFFFYLLCFYWCDRAFDACRLGGLRKASGWLLLLIGTSLVGGTIRQVIWIAPAVFLPCLAWLCRGDRRVLGLLALFWTLNLVGAFACLHWFKQQPYAIVDRPTEGVAEFLHSLPFSLIRFVPLVLTALLLTLPVLTGTWRADLWANPSSRRLAAGIVVTSAVLTLAASHAHHLMPWMGNLITAFGVMGPWVMSFGDVPHTLPFMMRLVLTFLVFAVGATLLVSAFLSRRALFPSLDRSAAEPPPLILPLFWIYILCYTPLLVLRMHTEGTYDRYLMEVLPAVALSVLWHYQRSGGRRVSVFGYVLLVLFAGYGIATTHDYIAAARARLAAADTLTTAGIPRTQIMAGLEYDGWTQIEQTGYFNDPRILIPPGAYHTGPARVWPLDSYPFVMQTPSIAYDYFVVLSPQPRLRNTPFPAVDYMTWLPPFHRRVLVQRVDNAAP